MQADVQSTQTKCLQDQNAGIKLDSVFYAGIADVISQPVGIFAYAAHIYVYVA